jgi:hypothetical protein
LITDGTMPTGKSFSAFQKLCTPAPNRVMAIFGAGVHNLGAVIAAV